MRVVVGSSDLPLSVEIISHVASVFSVADPDEAFGVRVPHDDDNPISPVERLVVAMATRLDRKIIRFSPTKGGRSAVFHRDYDLVTGAEEVVALFSPDREMDGGTGHVVKAALDRGVKVTAFSTHPDGTLVFLGSEEPNGGSVNTVLSRMYEEALDEW